MNIRDLCIIDVDSHLTEPHDLWTRNAPAAYADRVPRVVDVDGIPTWAIDDVVLSRATASGVIRPDGEKSAGVEFLEWSIDDVHPGAYDMAARLEVLDELDIYAQILYPNVAGFGAQKFGLVEDPELRRLCATLYNDAMVEIQEVSNGRLLPMGLMPWWDVEGSIAEVERCAANGLRGVNLCSDPQSRGAAELWEPAWDPFWAACADHAMPVNFHIGASDTSMSWFGTSPWPGLDEDRKIAIGSAMMYLSNARIIANLVFSGVLERFPTVKFVSVESGIGWMPFFLESLDYQLYETAPSAVAELSMLPSEYFKRQVYGCFWFEARQLQSVIDALGVTQVLFETDFPHPTCLYPDPIAWVDKALADVDDHTKQRVLQDNAAELYKIPLPVERVVVTTPEAAGAVAARFFDRMGHFDWEAMGACVAEDVERVGPYRDQKAGRDDYQQFLAETIEALDDYHLDVQRIWSDGTHVVAQLSETLNVDGRPRRTDEAIVLDIGPNGLIARVEVYLQKGYFVDDEDEIVRPS